jgi:hypothetical protein
MTNKKRLEFLTNLTEHQLFQLMRTRYTGLIDLNQKDEKSLIDWYDVNEDIWMEAKCRNEHYNGMLIQKDKYDVLMKKENCYYVNSTPKGIFVFNLKEMEEPVWREQNMEQSQFFKSNGRISKWVAELPIAKAIQIDHLLIPYD